MKKFVLISSMVLSLGVFAGCGSQNTKDAKSSATTVSQSTTKSSSQSSSASSTSASSSTDNVNGYKVSLTDAIDTYKETYPDTDIISISLDSSLGKTFYSIEGVDDNKEYEVKINTDTKEVKKDRVESLDNDEKNGVKRKENKLDLTNMKDMSEIFDIAVKEAGFGKVTDWEIKEKLGVTYWEVSVEEGMTKEADLKINAQTGEIVEREND